MAKPRRPQRQNQPGTGQTGARPAGNTPTQRGPDLTKDIDLLHGQTKSHSLEGDLVGITVPPSPSQAQLEENWRKIQELNQVLTLQKGRAEQAEAKSESARKGYEAKTEALRIEYEKKQRELSITEDSLRSQLAELEPERQRLCDEETRLKNWDSELSSTEERLQHEASRLKQQELDAEAGLVARKRELLAGIEGEVGQFRETIGNLAHSIIEERSRALAELQEELKTLRVKEEQRLKQAESQLLDEVEQLRGDLAKQQDELRQDREGVLRDRGSIRQSRARLEADQQLLREDQKALEEKIERLVAARSANLADKLKATEDLLQKAQADRQQLTILLAQRADLDQQFKGRTPENVFRELEELKRDRQRLTQELTSRPSEDDLARLRALDEERQEWEAERSQIKRRVTELEYNIARYQTSVIDVETLRDQKAAYEASNHLLRKHLEELRTDVERRVSQGSQKEVYPACLAMDRDVALQDEAETEDVADLAKLVQDLQQRMAYDPKTRKELYYSIPDVRCFLAGLAMTRLVIVQGVSGTGKTSLPLAFARAIGGGEAFVEVQAGWRDRQDLIGHFNSFEGKFYESKFLQALYEAQSPSYHDRPYLIVLDEMNLSHAEQYFADLIAALELPDEAKRKLDLLTGPLPEGAVPRLLINSGRTLKIPTNVWFVGTANQDETTKDFADKTYDRAHIMELPIKHPRFDVKPPQSDPPRLSCTSLRTAFATAKLQYADKAEHAYAFLEDNIREFVGTRFRIGWGNRLQRQIEDYVPVVLAANGSLSEAMDYLLAMKVFRKIRSRYENRVSDIEALRDHLESVWPTLDQVDLDPTNSKQMQILTTELSRLRSTRAEETEL